MKKALGLMLVLSLSTLMISCATMDTSKQGADEIKPIEKEVEGQDSNASTKNKADDKNDRENIDYKITISKEEFDLKEELDILGLGCLTVDELGLLKNAIYAKHGYVFETKELSDFFSEQPWYEPLKSNGDLELNTIDTGNVESILKLIEARETYQRLYMIGNIYNADKSEYTFDNLIIEKVDIPEGEGFNNPVALKMKAGDKTIDFKDDMNDGIYLYETDIDPDDDYRDIIITSTGLDIGCMTYFYRYNSEGIYEYSQFYHMFNSILYDKQGLFYYVSEDNYGEDYIVGTAFSYKENVTIKVPEDKRATITAIF